MEEGSWLKEDQVKVKEEEILLTWDAIIEEVKKLLYLAGPMIGMSLCQMMMQMISIMMVGHLGELALASTAIAISFCGVTGFSIMMGMAGALETLCGQAYGAKQYQKLGRQTYAAILSLIIVCVLLSVLWLNLERILLIMGQDPLISHEAGKFAMWLVPALFGYATIQPLVRFFQMQSLLTPMIISSSATVCFHLVACWVLVYKTELKSLGASLAMCFSMWLNAAILGLYMAFHPSCAQTRVPFSWEIFGEIKEFFRFAIPSAVMVCLEWWSYELLVLLSGLLPNPELEASVLSACLTTLTTLYAVPYGLSAAVSTRVSNELGDGNPRRAHISVFAVMLLTVIETILINLILIVNRGDFGYIFSNEKQIVDYVTDMASLVCLSVFMDGLQATLSGVARGCGWQHIGAYVNLASFYVVGIPIAVILAFLVRLRGKGLWIGIVSGATIQTILMSIITGCTNWEKEAKKARERLFKEEYLSDDTGTIQLSTK